MMPHAAKPRRRNGQDEFQQGDFRGSAGGEEQVERDHGPTSNEPCWEIVVDRV